MSTVKQTVEVVTLNTLDNEDNENSCASVPKDDENMEKLSSQTNVISNTNTERRTRESSTGKVFFISRAALVNSSQPLQERPFECEFCFRRFSQKQTLKNHIITHTGLRPFSCQYCDKTFTQASALKRHTALHKEDKKEFSCHLCTLSFRQLNNLKRHEKLHTPDAALSFVCEICLRQFARKDGLKRHAKRHLSKREMFFCGFCEKSFASPITHARHEQNHRNNGEEKAKCQQCCGSFVRKGVPRIQTVPSNNEFTPRLGHQAPSSNKFVSSKETSSIEKADAENLCPPCRSKPNVSLVCIHVCSICHMEFASKAKLRTHTELLHMDEVSKFTCKLCDKSFVTRSHLEKHCLVHRNEKGVANMDIYQCYYCDLLFTNREGIIRHVRWHEKKLHGKVVREKKKRSKNEHMETVFIKEMGSFLNEDLYINDSAVETEYYSYVDKEKKRRPQNERNESDFPLEEIRSGDPVNEHLYLDDSEVKMMENNSEEILSDVEDRKDSNPLIKSELIEEKDFEGELGQENHLSPSNTIRNVQNKFDIPYNENNRFNIIENDTSKEEEEVTLRLGSEQIQLIKVTPMEHYVHGSNKTEESNNIDPLAINKIEEFEEKNDPRKFEYIEDTVNESIETIHDNNAAYDDYTNEQFTIKSETDATSEVGSELIRSETFTEDLDDKNSVKSINTFSEVGKNSISSMSILTNISSNLPKEISFANLSKDIRDMIDFDGSYQIDVSKECTQSNEISSSNLIYSMKKSKPTLSNELIDDMIVDLLNTTENNPINVVYENDKPIGIVYENDETIEVIQHVEDTTQELDIKYVETIRDNNQLEDNSVDIMNNAESVMSGNENDIKHEEHEGDGEIHYEIADNKLEVLQQYATDDNEKFLHDQIEDDTTTHEKTNIVDQEDSEQKFVLLEVPDKDLMFLLDERTTSAPNSPQDIDDDFNDTFDDKTNETTREKDANGSICEGMMFGSIGNVKLKRPSRNRRIKNDNIEVPDEMLYHLSKVNFKRPPVDPKTSPNKFQSGLCANKNSLSKNNMLKSGKMKNQIVEEVCVYDCENEKSYFCYVCKKSYTSKNSLKRHFKTTHNMTDSEKFSCSLCQKTFKAKDALQKHVRSLHAPHQFKCDVCRKTFNRKDALASHARLHAAEKPFVCDVCGEKFTQKQNLYAHKLKHRDKKHICQYCEKSFYTKQLRDKHHLTHTNERLFQCTKCNMSFKQKNHLHNHYLVHGEMHYKTYKCNDCGIIFNRKASLQRHMVRHLRRETFFCTHCGKGMNHRDTLEKHLKNKVCTKRLKVIRE